jgi:hypothetical protein
MREMFDDANQPTGYCTVENPSWPVENSSTCSGPNNNILFKFTIEFSDPDASNYNFEFGVDFGLGGQIFVDSALEVSRTDDLWWAGNWDSSDVFKFSKNFTAG